jgi:N-acetyl-gamma-glutamyl-phosphate reductase
MSLHVGILGGTGYAGGELCRLLLNHPAVTSITPTARSGEDLERVHPNLLGSGLRFCAPDQLRELAARLDVVFFCTPSGEAMQEAQHFLDHGVKVIDLSADFRFASAERYTQVYGGTHLAPGLLEEAVYGVTELHRKEVAPARLIANPGCYAITAILGLAPVLATGMADLDRDLHVTAINGTSGAGTKPLREIMHAESFASMLPYSLDGHRHAPELEDQLGAIAGRDLRVDLNTAHGNFVRGIYIQASVTAARDVAAELDRPTLTELYRRHYADEFFVRINGQPTSGRLNAKEYSAYPSLAAVTGSNFCHIGLDVDRRRGLIKVVAVTDNLVKGAAGSGIQNLNLMFGLAETAGLTQYGL